MTSIKKSGAITLIAQITTFAIGFAIQIVLARILGPSDRGVYALLILIPAISVMLSSLGIEIANVYFSANKKYKLRDIASNSLVTGTGLGLVVVLLFWGLSDVAAFQDFLRQKGIEPTYLWVAILALPFLLLQSFFSRILLGREEIVKFNALNISQNVLQMALIALLMVGLAQGLRGAIWAYTITIIIIAILSILYVRRLTPVGLSINRNLLKESIRYGGIGYLGNAAQYLSYRIDIIIMAYFLSSAAIGYYSIAVGIAERLWMIPSSLAIVLFPRISAINDDKANELTPKVARHTLFIVFVFSLMLLVLGKPLILILFGADFMPSLAPLLILLPGVVAFSISKVISSDLSGRGKPVFGAIASFASLAVNIGLNLYLIPRWGISGAAFSSSVSYSMAAAVMIAAFVRLTQTPLSDVLLLKAGDVRIYLDMVLKAKQRLINREAEVN